MAEHQSTCQLLIDAFRARVIGLQSVAQAALGLDQTTIMAIVNLAAQAGNVDIDHIGKGVFVHSLNVGKNALSTEELARRVHQKLKQCEFLCCQ